MKNYSLSKCPCLLSVGCSCVVRYHEFSRLGSKVAPNTSQNVHCQSKLERGKCKMHRHQRIGMHNGNNCFFDEECVKGSSKKFKTPTTKFAIAFQFVRCEKHFQLFSVSDIWQGTSTSNDSPLISSVNNMFLRWWIWWVGVQPIVGGNGSRNVRKLFCNWQWR